MSHDWLDTASSEDVLREIARQLARIGDTLDELRPDPCGHPNVFSLPGATVRSEDIRYCERNSGHPRDFHMAGDQRWVA